MSSPSLPPSWPSLDELLPIPDSTPAEHDLIRTVRQLAANRQAHAAAIQAIADAERRASAARQRYELRYGTGALL